MRNDDSLATISLVSQLRGKEVQTLKASDYWKLCDELGKPSVLLKLNQIGGDLYLSERIVRLLDRARAMAFELEKLEQSGIKTITPFDDCYPNRFRTQLVNKAPAVLHVAGDLDLLERLGVGIVGSRDVTEEGAAVAKEAAERATRLGFMLVSGGARGVDQIAMNAALEADGAVVGALAEAFLQKVKNRDARRAILGGRAVMFTPYSPDAAFSVGRAMGRNKLIYAMSLITLVVASDVDKGGTWSGAVEALKYGFGRVAVWRGPGEGPGNKVLVEKGAVPISSMDDLERALCEVREHRIGIGAQPGSVSVEPIRAVQPSVVDADGPTSEIHHVGAETVSAESDPVTPSNQPDASSPQLRLSDPERTRKCRCGCGKDTRSVFARGCAVRTANRVIAEKYGGEENFLAEKGHFDSETPGVVSDEPPAEAQQSLIPFEKSVSERTRKCWCGCGKNTKSLLTKACAVRAVRRFIKDEFGGYVDFLAEHGYGS